MSEITVKFNFESLSVTTQATDGSVTTDTLSVRHFYARLARMCRMRGLCLCEQTFDASGPHVLAIFTATPEQCQIFADTAGPFIPACAIGTCEECPMARTCPDEEG